jgi:dGTPase
MNRDLTEAISLGHDLGHSPFGHIGEAVLDRLYKDRVPHGSFRHAEFSLRIIDELEGNNAWPGLNLTWETRDGILYHSKGLRNLADLSDISNIPSTIEGQIVRIVDRIAYVSHDFDDSIHGGIFKWEDVPPEILSLFSQGTSHVINYFASNLILNFNQHNQIVLSKKQLYLLDSAKKFLTSHVYSHPSFLPVRAQIMELLSELFQFYWDHPEKMEGYETFSFPGKQVDKYKKCRAIIDYLAGMTDRYATTQYETLFQKRIQWKSKST